MSLPSSRLGVLLQALSDGATLEQLKEVTGRSRATVYRYLSDLRRLGMVIRLDQGRVYRVYDWGIFRPTTKKEENHV